MKTLPRADTAGYFLDGLALFLQLLCHVLQILFVIPVGILQKLIAAHREDPKCVAE